MNGLILVAHELRLAMQGVTVIELSDEPAWLAWDAAVRQLDQPIKDEHDHQ